jgi:putative oxidoreductase
MVTGTMVTAIRKVHAPNGPWVTANGYEYNLTLIALTAALTETGPGSPSVDSALFGDGLKGRGWALAALAAGVAGSYLVTERLVEPEPELADVEMDDPSLAGQPRFERETETAQQNA